jgi:serine/threonine protein kinase
MTRDGKKKINQYIVMRLIGKGNFGKVKLVYDTEQNNQPYAMKIIPKRKKIKGLIGGKLTSELDDIMNEIAVMKKLVRATFFCDLLFYRTTKM